MPRSWGELHLPPEHYLIVHLPSSDPPGRKTEGQSAAPACDELARFMLGDEQFCIVRAVGLEGASLVALGRLNKQIAAQLHISDLELPGRISVSFVTSGSGVRAACLLAVLARPEGDRDDPRRPLAVAVGEDSRPSVRFMAPRVCRDPTDPVMGARSRRGRCGANGVHRSELVKGMEYAVL